MSKIRRISLSTLENKNEEERGKQRENVSLRSFRIKFNVFFHYFTLKFISSIYLGSKHGGNTKRIKYFPAALSRSSQLFAFLSLLPFGPEELERNVFNKGWEILR